MCSGGHPAWSRPSLKPATSQQSLLWEADPLLSELKAMFLAQSAAHLYEVSGGRFSNGLPPLPAGLHRWSFLNLYASIYDDAALIQDISHSGIDLYLLSTQLFDRVLEFEYLSRVLSDHSLLTLSISFCDVPRNPYRWCLNPTLLQRAKHFRTFKYSGLRRWCVNNHCHAGRSSHTPSSISIFVPSSFLWLRERVFFPKKVAIHGLNTSTLFNLKADPKHDVSTAMLHIGVGRAAKIFT